MKKTFSILILFFAFLISNATKYYITTAGTNTFVGTSEATAWKTLTYAVGVSSPVAAGDTIFAKGGNYGNENIVFSKQGTFGHPITIIGYCTIPGELIGALVSNANPYAAYTTTAMPTYTGSNRNTGICMDLRQKNYIKMKNFQITAYENGVIGGATDTSESIVLENVNCMTLGNTATGQYSGQGILLGQMTDHWCDHSSVTNCLMVNCSAEMFNIVGNHNTVLGCKAYCNEDNTGGSRETDYYYVFSGNENQAWYCHAELADAASTYSATTGNHGYSCKTNAEQVVDAMTTTIVITSQHNSFFYCTARNMDEGFSAHHRGAQYNLFYHCGAKGTYTGGVASGYGNGITCRDGAQFNTWDGCYIDSVKKGIEMYDTSEDGTGYPNHGNVIKNCWFANIYIGIFYSNPTGSLTTEIGDNTIAHCSFWYTRDLFDCQARCTTMVYKSNIFMGNASTGTNGHFRTDTYSSDVTGGQFTDCNFYEQYGGMPGGFVAASINGYTVNPTFVSTSGRDFRLQSSSGLINSSTSEVRTTTTVPSGLFASPNNNLGVFDPTQNYWRDFNGVNRWLPTPNIGAY